MRNGFISDPWSGLSHKAVIGDNAWRSDNSLSWARGNGRRLTAYKVLQAYLDNSSRHYLPTGDAKEVADHREYGDAQLIVDSVVAALLGNDQEVVVPAAGDVPTALIDPSKPNDLTPEEQAQQAAAERAQVREDELRQWFDDEKMKLKMLEVEADAVGLGDGVYVMGWSPQKRRAQVRIYDASVYFPKLEGTEDFPTEITLAWEVVADSEGEWVEVEADQPNPPAVDATDQPRRLRKITYRLGVPLDGQARRYGWLKPEAEPSMVTCFMTDGIYPLEGDVRVDRNDVPASQYLVTMGPDGAPVEMRDLDLMIDFIPVIHIPNTPSMKHHFGVSVLSRIAQILDDLQNADTDRNAAADITGTPPIAISGAVSEKTVTTYGPGQVFNLGSEGKMDVLNTSGSLDAITTHIDSLLDRMSVNARISQAVLGRLQGEIPSGISLALLFGPLSSMIDQMRLVRTDKYPLLLKFAQRFAIAGKVMEGPEQDAVVTFGSFLPVDKTQAVEAVTQLLNANAISRLTAVSMLIEAGFPIDDATEEVERIQREDFKGAEDLLAALGDEQAVSDYLGRQITNPLPAPPPAPSNTPPAVPPAPPNNPANAPGSGGEPANA